MTIQESTPAFTANQPDTCMSMRACLKMGMWPIHHRLISLSPVWAAASEVSLYGFEKAHTSSAILLCCFLLHPPHPKVSPEAQPLSRFARPFLACHDLHLDVGPQLYVTMTGCVHKAYQSLALQS
jgi:hypothetical protein